MYQVVNILAILKHNVKIAIENFDIQNKCIDNIQNKNTHNVV